MRTDLPEVTSSLELTAKDSPSQLCSHSLDEKMSTTNKDSQDCNMDLSQVEITDVSVKFGLLCGNVKLWCRCEV